MSNMEDHYSNREIDRMFGEIMTVLQRIEAQTTKTNGRVNALEKWKDGVMARVTTIVAGLGIIWVGIKEFILK